MTSSVEPADPDRALVAACARGDHSAFETLVGRYGSDLRAGCVRALTSAKGLVGSADVEEAEAEVLSRLWRDAPSFFGRFRFSCPLEAWLRLMAYRTALNWIVSERRRAGQRLDVAGDPAAMSNPDGLEAEEALASLRMGLQRLGGLDRELLEGVYLKGMNYRHLAQHLGIPAGNVGPMLTRAKGKLSKIVKTLSEGGGDA